MIATPPLPVEGQMMHSRKKIDPCPDCPHAWHGLPCIGHGCGCASSFKDESGE